MSPSTPQNVNSVAGEPTSEEIRDQKIYTQWGLTVEEYELICDKILGRLPTYTEAGVFAVMWSEHCSYKNSKDVLRQFPTSGPRVLQGPGEGAGIVDIGDGLAVVFKAESHNHPSAVEPYEGAATGVGGIVRDIFSMGARPIASLNSLRFGELSNDRTAYLFQEVVAGIGGYGNCIGIPTVGGEISFDPCYEANPLVNAMCVGIIAHEDIQKGRAKGLGNSIMYVGAKTGRDGIHGATFASESFDDEAEQNRSAVQVGDPFMEKLLLEACLDLIHNHGDLLVGIQDMGAAGLVSSSSEMAAKAGSGLVLHLDDVPVREPNMTPYEMMLSESQERMLICVYAGREKEVEELFARYDLDAVTIGTVTDDGQYRLFFAGQEVANLPVDALAAAPPVHPQAACPTRLAEFSDLPDFVPDVSDPTKVLLELLTQPTIASKRSVYETYDCQVGANTVVTPGSDAAVLRVRGTDKALAMTTDCNSRYIYLDPFVGGQIAVSEAARNIVASGALPLAITDCLNYGSPENPQAYYELRESTRGISQACRAHKTPVISGNVSLYNESNGEPIYPTPMIGMVGLIEDHAHITTSYFKNPGDLIYVIGATGTDFNGSELQKLQLGRIEGRLFPFSLEEEVANSLAVLEAIHAGLVASAHDVSEGGLAVALAECCFVPGPDSTVNTEFGVSPVLNVDGAETIEETFPIPVANFFAETQSRFVISVRPQNASDFEALMGTRAQKLGTVSADGNIHLRGVDGEILLSTARAAATWEGAIPCLLK